MPDRIPTVVLYATGVPRLARVVADTLRGPLGGLLAALSRRLPPDRFLALRADEYGVLSYVRDWLDAFCRSPLLAVRAVNVNNLAEMAAAIPALTRAPLVVVLHSAAGDNLSWLRRWNGALQHRRGALLVFFGNEYLLMDQKIAFASEVQADFIGSQLRLDSAQWVYTPSKHSTVLPAPPALNPDVYRPLGLERKVDVGFRGELYDSALLGTDERTRIVRYFADNGPRLGLRTDVAYTRVPRGDWAAFLNQCRAIPGAEAGALFAERDDTRRQAVNAYRSQHPVASLQELFQAYCHLAPPTPSGRAISSRHFEPIGTRTCQVLVEGAYNGILRAGEHYIGVRPDLSDVDDAVEQLRDKVLCEHITSAAYEHTMASHTYAHRIESLVEAVRPRLP